MLTDPFRTAEKGVHPGAQRPGPVRSRRTQVTGADPHKKAPPPRSEAGALFSGRLRSAAEHRGDALVGALIGLVALGQRRRDAGQQRLPLVQRLVPVVLRLLVGLLRATGPALRERLQVVRELVELVLDLLAGLLASVGGLFNRPVTDLDGAVRHFFPPISSKLGWMVSGGDLFTGRPGPNPAG